MLVGISICCVSTTILAASAGLSDMDSASDGVKNVALAFLVISAYTFCIGFGISLGSVIFVILYIYFFSYLYKINKYNIYIYIYILFN
jgi:hypothetical protein